METTAREYLPGTDGDWKVVLQTNDEGDPVLVIVGLRMIGEDGIVREGQLPLIAEQAAKLGWELVLASSSIDDGYGWRLAIADEARS